MAADWLILHAGALGDLVLTIQLGLRLPGVRQTGRLRVVSRTNPGDLSGCTPSVVHQSSDGLGTHWLFQGDIAPPPSLLEGMVGGRRVLSALGGRDSGAHARLRKLGPAEVYSFDPRPGEARTEQNRTQSGGESESLARKRPDAKLLVKERPSGRTQHITAEWARGLEGQGLLLEKCAYAGRGGGATALTVPERIRAAGKATLDRAGAPDPAAIIHPGSGGRAKCWPLANFVAVGRLARAAGREPCFLLGPVERERWTTDEFDAIRREFPLIQAPPPDQLVALLAAANVLISNDSGPAHLAALLGTPTVTIFGPTRAAVWRPLGARTTAIQGDAGADARTWGLRPEIVAAAAAQFVVRGTGDS
jgi:hypothetical protein